MNVFYTFIHFQYDSYLNSLGASITMSGSTLENSEGIQNKVIKYNKVTRSLKEHDYNL